MNKTSDELVGNTPLIELVGMERAHGLKARVFAKLELFNPTGSVKDRIAKAMIDDAERRGVLRTGGVIIEPTSGNTGIALAAIAARRGYKAIIVMPDSMSAERIKIMRAYGAEVVLTDGKRGMSGAVERACAICKETENSFVPSQFDNPINVEAHFNSTGPEIECDLGKTADVFAACVGTGGTLIGTARYLKSRGTVKTVAIEPAGSPVLSGGAAGRHKIQGIGAGFVPKLFDRSVVDEILQVTDDDAFETAEDVRKHEGISVGISSGAAAFGAVRLALRPENEGKNIVTVFPDGGDRYYSTELFV